MDPAYLVALATTYGLSFGVDGDNVSHLFLVEGQVQTPWNLTVRAEAGALDSRPTNPSALLLYEYGRGMFSMAAGAGATVPMRDYEDDTIRQTIRATMGGRTSSWRYLPATSFLLLVLRGDLRVPSGFGLSGEMTTAVGLPMPLSDDRQIVQFRIGPSYDRGIWYVGLEGIIHSSFRSGRSGGIFNVAGGPIAGARWAWFQVQVSAFSSQTSPKPFLDLKVAATF